ncbi:cupin-like domain-containing protein [Fodinicurvata sp. EGI_FJ10296]|uniref:cupin-like domain-containing protein n=1 Tax=Fodinicurvata sp. EGI_FJ10296 TaxID=3231908 RepID=UPI003452A189
MHSHLQNRSLGAVPTHIPTSSLHRDPLTGFLLQVIGRKRLDLYSADQAELIYPMKSYNLYQPCWFKPEAPNYDLYPKARDAKCISVTLEPGQLMLQPAGWFHQVHALDDLFGAVSFGGGGGGGGSALGCPAREQERRVTGKTGMANKPVTFGAPNVAPTITS